MIPFAARRALDRLVTAVMTLVRAVAPTDAPTGAQTRKPALPEAAAHALFYRLCLLVPHLIRIGNFGLRASPKPAAKAPNPPAPPPAARPARLKGTNALPRRPGWLLAAIPDIAQPVAAEIAALLADPAIATLLDRAPSLNRTLRPLLRSLGLAAPPTPAPPAPAPRTASPSPNPPAAPPPNPANPPARRPAVIASAAKLALLTTTSVHAILVT